ncbi:cytochrome c1 [Paracoccus onubensis]|uniref:Cytochrome c1 n=1 Tax=Paracoccus onubensis TaxID=1675788 RepID=A0A418SR68_9RHOB|nr:cytochrome c1 [Paracoccus onubensis]
MTLRTKTLTAVAALTILAGGYSLAQEAETDQPADAQQSIPESDALTEAPAGAEAESEATEGEAAGQPADAEEAGAEEPAADDAAAEEAPAEGEATDGDAAEQPADAAEEAGAEEPAADDAAAEEAPAEDEASEGAAADEEHAEAAGDHGGGHIEDISFSFEGPFGKYDQFQLQRGLQVYTEVCSACHGMKFVPLRTLGDSGGPGLPEDQVRAYAAEMTIIDEETEEERPRLPTDHFPENTTAGAPDLSLMAKARAGFHGPAGTGVNQLIKGIGGPEYIHAILTSYTGEEQEQAGTVLYENTAFPTGYIGMTPPLSDDLVTYEDGTKATVDQMARDVSAFLMWTAEPKLSDRKQVGLVSVLFLIVLTGLLYVTNKRLWAPYKGKNLDR